MLKKLVKYGNSNALVLDKALLELLNIEEGSLVKIKTDGNSLIITPHKKQEQEKITSTVVPYETLQNAVQQHMAQIYGSTENANSYMNELREVFTRYASAMKKLDAPEIQQSLQELEQKFNNDRQNPEFIQTATVMRLQYAPELLQMDKEIAAINKKYAPEEHQYSDAQRGKFALSMTNFKKTHEKYRHVQEQVMKLNDNHDYIHESVLLAEKFHATKKSPEYIQEYTQLITKYIPEYAEYQDELKKAAELLK